MGANKKDLDERAKDFTSQSLSIALIDDHRFSQQCLVNALQCHLELEAKCFDTVDNIFDEPINLDVIVYHSHSPTIVDPTLINGVVQMAEAFTTIPLVIISDAHDALESLSIRKILKSGARGVIGTRTTSLSLVVAALLFVKAGGTFAPVDILSGNASERPLPIPPPERNPQFTARQVVVLDHMARGSANKIIAHELQMSESTVKVHVRNIMRKVGATNRTQAVYKSKRLLQGASKV